MLRTLGVTIALLSLTSVLPSCLSHATTAVPGYEIHLWDKNGDLLINGQCPRYSQCYWYRWGRDIQGGQTRVSNTSTLDLKAQNSEYDEYYLMNDQNKSIVQYALIVPNANAGSPFNSNFISICACQTGIPHSVGFWYTININKRAIDTGQPCELIWNGLPHCAFTADSGLCSYNGSDFITNKFSVRCLLNKRLTPKDIYICSNPMMIDVVDSLPLCPSENASNITYESISISSTSTLVVPMNDTQPAPTASTKTTSHIVVITTTSSAASVMNHTVTSALTATSVHPISSSLATINATHETSTPTSSPSATTSGTEHRRNIIIGGSVAAAGAVLFALCLLVLIMIFKVYVFKKKNL